VKTGINARKSGASIIKIVMFDEVNEDTAILKAAPSRADAPAQGYWLTLDADGDTLPNDWYLRLAGEIGRMCRGGVHPSATLPTHPGLRGDEASERRNIGGTSHSFKFGDVPYSIRLRTRTTCE
jgi:hypothetical protein